MNELIKVNYDGERQTVSARELHEKLGIEKHFTQWWEQQAATLDLIEGKDFLTYRLESTGGRPGTDIIIPLDIAKHLAMISKGEKSHMIRDYFIEVEKRWNSPDAVMARALKMAERKMFELKNTNIILESKVKELTPAAEFGNAVSNNAGGILIRDYVKVLENDGIRIGQDRLFSWLHLNKYIYRIRGYKPQWIPYKQYVEQGLFRVKETPVSTPDHGDWISYTIRITGKGQKYFYEKLKAEFKPQLAAKCRSSS